MIGFVAIYAPLMKVNVSIWIKSMHMVVGATNDV